MTPDVFVKLLFGRKEATYFTPVKVGAFNYFSEVECDNIDRKLPHKKSKVFVNACVTVY